MLLQVYAIIYREVYKLDFFQVFCAETVNYVLEGQRYSLYITELLVLVITSFLSFPPRFWLICLTMLSFVVREKMCRVQKAIETPSIDIDETKLA